MLKNNSSPRPRGLRHHLRASLSSLVFLFSFLFTPSASIRAEEKVQIAELSPQAEAAIDKGLRFLASSQNENGSWGKKYPVAHTALALMAFMVKGYFPSRPPFGDAMAKGVDFLLQESVAGGGYLGSVMYEHGLATLALSEVWGMSDREEVREAVKQAVSVLIRAQSPKGGWRYQPVPHEADLSVTVMQVVALASAKEAGILVPNEVIEKALAYVKSCQHPFSGGFGYMPGDGPEFARSAAGAMSLLMCGERGSRAVQAGLSYLKKSPATKFRDASFYYYGHYYAIQAMYQGGEEWYQEWYPSIRDALLARQGHEGAWIPHQGGDDPAYCTAMSILILGVPYRFLPIYQR